MSQCRVSYLKPCTGLCKTLTLDWTGLWTGLDRPKQLYTDSEHHQSFNCFSSALPQVAS